jgi:hypothetical protein
MCYKSLPYARSADPYAKGDPLTKLKILAVAAGAAMTVFGPGVPCAQGSPSVSGEKFSDASEALKKAGYTVQVSSTVGDRLPQSDCVVTAQSDSAPRAFGPSQFNANKEPTVSLSLNCDATVASATDAGYSAASPEGQKSAKVKDSIEWERTPEGQQWCKENKKTHPDWGWNRPWAAGCNSPG